MDRGDSSLSGVFAPVVTPFRRDEPDLEALRDNLRKLRQSDLRGYMALGSNGESRSLSEKEESRVLAVFAEEKAEKVVMAGVGCESSSQTIEKAKRAAAMGFEYASALTPHYFPKQINDEVLYAYYCRVADQSPIPILLYNAPGFTGGVSLSAACVARLAAHGNIAGMKDSSAAGPGLILTKLREKEGKREGTGSGRAGQNRQEFSVLAGSANFFFPSLLLGAVGGVLSIANYLPDLCCKIHQLFTEGSFKEARDLHHRIVKLNTAVSGRFGVAGVKAAMDFAGYRGGEPRHPLPGLSESEKAALRNALEEESEVRQSEGDAGGR
jgi:4-hydroxy-2-oxoglutarate aldolase